MSFATPALGPVAGNTTIFSGAGLGGGTHYRCRIGRGDDVPASDGGVACATPPGLVLGAVARRASRSASRLAQRSAVGAADERAPR